MTPVGMPRTLRDVGVTALCAGGVPLSWDLATVAMYIARLWDYAFLWQPPPPILCTLVSLV